MGSRVPVPNETRNRFDFQAIGNKEDAAVSVPGSSASILAYLKHLVSVSQGGSQLFTEFFADTDGAGDDANDGLSWGTAKATIGACMTLAAALGTRGRARIFVAPGGYTEDVVTPTNAECAFGQLIAVNPTLGNTFGATWIKASTAATPAIKVLARGWQVRGFEIAPVANTEAILLDGENGTPSGFQLVDCLVSGWALAGAIGLDVTGNGAPHTRLLNCRFTDFKGSAIKSTSSGTDQARFWRIDGCMFADNTNHIAMNPRGFKESIIQNCHFLKIGANQTATLQLDNRGGNATVIGPNNFLSSTYANTGGYYAGSNETWRGNHTEDSDSGTTGTGQVNPAG